MKVTSNVKMQVHLKFCELECLEEVLQGNIGAWCAFQRNYE